MEVRETYSINELYGKLKNYDLVFTSEAALMSALNDRLEKPIVGHFAVTPLNYVLSDYQNQKLLQDRGLFIETVKRTDLTWKQASYLIENILDCWKEEGSPESIKKYNGFNTEATNKVLRVIQNSKNVFREMQNYEIDEDKDVAVINFHQFNELDKQVLPEEYERFKLFKEEEKYQLPEFKIFSSTTEIVRTVVENIDEENAQDTAVVLNRESQYSALIESTLESQGIPVMRQENLSEDEDLRTFIQLLELGINQERRLVKDCQPVLKKLGIEVPIKKNNDYISDLETDQITEFKEILASIEGSTVKEALKHLEEHINTDLEEDLEELGILTAEINEETVNKLKYYLDTYNVEKESMGAGVLLADSKSSAIVDRPIIFYLGMDSSWTPNISNKPWKDAEKQDETCLKNFKALIQNGEQQYYLVQDKLMNEDVTPCLYFNELTEEEFESFRDLPHSHYESSSGSQRDGFEKKDYNIDMRGVELISQSSLNSFVKSPKDYLFDKLTDSADQDYFRKGTLFHDFAEFYVNHPEFIKEKGRTKFVELMLQEMKSIVDDLELDTLETEFKVGIKNIINFVETEDLEETSVDGYTDKEDNENFFAEYFGKEVDSKITEAWFEDKDLGVQGMADLISSENRIVDYKSGDRKTAKSVVGSSNFELLEDDPNFQAMLYLTKLREANPGEKLEFVFYHFLDNIDEEMQGEADIEDNIVKITYYPKIFDRKVKDREVFDYIIEGVKESNDRRKTLEKLTYDEYREFFEGKEIEEKYDKDAIQETQLAEQFIEFCKERVGDYKYVEKGCKDALKQIVYFRRENYFKEDLDQFEEFVQTQLDLLNQYKRDSFPVQNPELEAEVEHENLDQEDMIPQ